MDDNVIIEDEEKETDPQIDCPLTIEDDVRLLELERRFFETSTAVLMNGRELHSLYEHIIKEVLLIEKDKNLDRKRSVKVPVDIFTSVHSSNDCDLSEASSITQRKSMTISNNLTWNDLSTTCVRDKSEIAEPNEKQTSFVKSRLRQKKKEILKSSISRSFEVVVPRLQIDNNYISSYSSNDDQTGMLETGQVLRVNESLSQNGEPITHQQPSTSSMSSEIPLPVELDESNESITRNRRTLRHRKRQAVIHDDSDDETAIKETPQQIPPPRQDLLDGLFSPAQHLSTQHHKDTSMDSSSSRDESLKPKVQRRRSKRHLTVCDEDTDIVHTRPVNSQQNYLMRDLSSSQKEAIAHSSVSPVSIEEKDSSWSPSLDQLSGSVSPQPRRTSSRLKGKEHKNTTDIVKKTQRRKKAQPSSTYSRTRSSNNLSLKEDLDTYVTSKDTHDDSLSKQKDQFPEDQSSLKEDHPLIKHPFVETTVTTIQEEPMKKPRNLPRKSRATRKPMPAPYVQNKKKLSPSKSNEPQSVEQSLTLSRLSISSMGLRRKTLLNSRQDSTLLLQDTFNDESEKQCRSLRQSGGSIRVSSKDFVAPKLKISKHDKAV